MGMRRDEPSWRGNPDRLPRNKNRDDHSALLQLTELTDHQIEDAIRYCPDDLIPALGLDDVDKSQVRWRSANG